MWFSWTRLYFPPKCWQVVVLAPSNGCRGSSQSQTATLDRVIHPRSGLRRIRRGSGTSAWTPPQDRRYLSVTYVATVIPASPGFTVLTNRCFELQALFRQAIRFVLASASVYIKYGCASRILGMFPSPVSKFRHLYLFLLSSATSF